mgnify:FL=1
MTNRVFEVPDISCDHCKRPIGEAVSAILDVDSVVVTEDRREVEVAGAVSDDAVIAAIQLAGYEVAQVSWPSTMAWTGKDPYCRLGGIR